MPRIRKPASEFVLFSVAGEKLGIPLPGKLDPDVGDMPDSKGRKIRCQRIFSRPGSGRIMGGSFDFIFLNIKMAWMQRKKGVHIFSMKLVGSVNIEGWYRFYQNRELSCLF